MIQTINPYATARTAQIMSRYRPIAPKPAAAEDDNSALPLGIRNSPYLSNVWAHLQSRPTRTRKRGRSAAFAPPPFKRTRTSNSPAMHGIPFHPNFNRGGLDLNVVPVELHLLPQEPVKPVVISPRPVRPVGSIIAVKSMKPEPCGGTVVKAAEEVEEGLEADMLPAIVSDSRNRVRICNLAYKEMVGQPECCWLDCKRIGGEVSLRFVDPTAAAMTGAAAFSCVVQIEWEREGEKFSVNGACSGVKLACEGKDYQYLWRFQINN